MILYALACDTGHRFESWFRDSAAFDTQAAAGFIACPTCHSTDVGKTIMAPALIGGRTNTAPESPVDAKVDLALFDDKSREVRALARRLREALLSEAQDVGRRFAVEARRMHDGDTPDRKIYGQASPAEAVALLEDGILILPLPMCPDEMT